MDIQRTSFAEGPEKIAAGPYDCVWIELAEREAPGPFRSPALQWLDWRLQGQISRLLIGPSSLLTTFIPTMRRIPIPYVAVVARRQVDWAGFIKQCEGLKLRSVLYFCEEIGRIPDAERDLRSQASGAFPETIAFADDTGALPGEAGWGGTSGQGNE